MKKGDQNSCWIVTGIELGFSTRHLRQIKNEVKERNVRVIERDTVAHQYA